MEENSEQTVQLINFKSEGELEITEDGINFLTNLKRQKISIVSIFGQNKHNTNLLTSLFKLSQKSKSLVGSSNGLAVWQHSHPLDSGAQLLFIKENHADKAKKEEEKKLFTLCGLLSSTIVYVCENTLNEKVIEDLASVANFRKQFLIAAEESDRNDYKEYIPNLVVLLVGNEKETKGINKESFDSLLNFLNENSESDVIKNHYRRIIRNNFGNKECMSLTTLGSKDPDDRKLSKEERKFHLEQLNQVESLLDHLKETIKPRILNHSSIDGEALFGIIENFVEYFNHDEVPIVRNAIDNILLDRANMQVMKLFEEFFKTSLKENFDPEKLPKDSAELNTEIRKLTEAFLIQVCSNMDDSLRPTQIAPIVNDIMNKIQYEASTIYDINKKLQDDWYDEEYQNILNSVKVTEYSKPEEAGVYFTNFAEVWLKGFERFLNIPNESSRSLLEIILKMLKENVFESVKTVGNRIADSYTEAVKDVNYQNENFKLKIKLLEEQLASEKKISDERQEEFTKTFEKKTELENKVEKLNREIKQREQETINNYKLENQKLIDLANENELEIKERDKKIATLERSIENLNLQILEKNTELTTQSSELNKEITRLTIDLEKFKSMSASKKSKNGEDSDLNIKFLFKTIQSTFSEFKDSLDKLDREKESIFKCKYLEITTKEMENKSKDWINEIKNFKSDQIKQITDSFEKTVNKLKDELEDSNMNLTRTQLKLEEEIQQKETLRIKVEECKKELNDYVSLNDKRDEMLGFQNDIIKVKEERIESLEKEKSDCEFKAAQNIMNFKMKEDELDTLLLAVDGLLGRRKDKYEHNVLKLSKETRDMLDEILVKYRIKL